MADNDVRVQIGATTWMFGTATTLPDGGKVHYIKNRPSRVVIALTEGATPIPVVKGDIVKVWFKDVKTPTDYPDFEGKLDRFKRTRDKLTIEAEDILGEGRSQIFNEVMFANIRRSERFAVTDDGQAIGLASAFKQGADVPQYPLIRVEYREEFVVAESEGTTGDLIVSSIVGDVRFCQLFRAEGRFLKSLDFGVVMKAGVAAISARVKIVQNNGSLSDPRPILDAPVRGLNNVPLSRSVTLADGGVANFTSLDFGQPEFGCLITGELYWVTVERLVQTNISEIEARGKTAAPREIPFRFLHGNGTTPSTYTAHDDKNMKLANMKVATLTERKFGQDFDVDETNHKIRWGGSSGFQPNTVGFFGRAWAWYAHSTEALAGAGKPINYVLARCGIGSTRYDVDAAGITATYGVFALKELDGIEALEEMLLNHYADAPFGSTGTRRGRFFASSTTGSAKVFVKAEKLVTDASWKTIRNGKDSPAAGEAILLEDNLEQVVKFGASRVVVIGKDVGDRPVAAFAENLSLFTTLGPRLKVEHDQHVRTTNEARDTAQAILDRDFVESYQGNIVIAGFWPEATGYFSLNSFNDVITLYDSDLGISNQKFRVEEVVVEWGTGGPRTTLILTQKADPKFIQGTIREVDRRTRRREQLDIPNELVLIFRDTNGNFDGTFAEMQISGTPVVGWDGLVHRAPVVALGGGRFVIVWRDQVLDLAGVDNPTGSRNITDIKFFDAYTGGTLKHTHTFSADDRVRPLNFQRVIFCDNQN